MAVKEYGWYSSTMAVKEGTSIYRLAGGGEIEVTAVTSSSTEHGFGPDFAADAMCAGEVTRFVRDGRHRPVLARLARLPDPSEYHYGQGQVKHLEEKPR